MNGRLPTLFVSHGAATLALDRAGEAPSHGGLAAALADIGREIRASGRARA
ncbi:MAG: hypothetical protein ACK515_00105 [bacterium]|nr:hypothetical protein [Betaproteobacteria bacterium]